ncbi:Diphthine methyl ester synthase [Schistosoma japonicum]|nr:Diphthine methyl ester synthase [Schistosoma japonicum]
MLYLIGVGLGSFSDLTIKGYDLLKKCDYVYFDNYTSIFSEEFSGLDIGGKCILPADREFVEQGSEILDQAKDHDVAFLVVGDPLGATTHSENKISYQIIHNASIITAVGCCGLHLYNFGATVSIPYWDEFSHPESFYDKMMVNIRSGLHTLCLLDIKVKERSLENILRDRKIYEPPRFMSCCEAVHQLLEVMNSKADIQKIGTNVTSTNPCIVICLSRIGSDDQKIVVSTIGDIDKTYLDSSKYGFNFGGPPHCMIIPGIIHELELEFLSARYRLNAEGQAYLPTFHTTQKHNPDILKTIQDAIKSHNELIRSIQLKLDCI